MYSIHNEENVKELFKDHKVQPFRYAQLENAIYKNFITEFNEIDLLPKDVRALLTENFFYYQNTQVIF